MSKVLNVLAVVAAMHGFGHCPARSPLPETPDFDRTVGLENDLPVLCKEKPRAVICHGHRGHALSLAEIRRVDAEYRAVFKYSTDRESKGSGSPYDNWSACGECTDYALTLSELLAIDGEDGRDMHLIGMLYCDKTGCDGHSRLWVRASDAGVVEIDNMHAPGVPRWEQGEYQDYVTMDGKRRDVPFPGWAIAHDGTYWIAK